MSITYDTNFRIYERLYDSIGVDHHCDSDLESIAD